MSRPYWRDHQGRWKHRVLKIARMLGGMDPDAELLGRLLVRAKALLRSAETVNQAAWGVLNNPGVDAIRQLRLALIQHDSVVLDDTTRDSLFPTD